jgi:MraZ protein
MFVGRFEHSLDPKGRVVLPAVFRDRLAAGGYVAKALDGCLAVWAPEDFEREAEEMVEKAKRGEISRSALRALSSGAATVKPDSQGRIAIPADLRAFAGLEHDVIVIGAFNSVELWDAARWEAVDRSGDALLSEPT